MTRVRMLRLLQLAVRRYAMRKIFVLCSWLVASDCSYKPTVTVSRWPNNLEQLDANPQTVTCRTSNAVTCRTSNVRCL